MNRIFTPRDAIVLVLIGVLIGVSLGFVLGVVAAERVQQSEPWTETVRIEGTRDV